MKIVDYTRKTELSDDEKAAMLLANLAYDYLRVDDSAISLMASAILVGAFTTGVLYRAKEGVNHDEIIEAIMHIVRSELIRAKEIVDTIDDIPELLGDKAPVEA